MSPLPTADDLKALLEYSFAHPYTFVLRPTVMTALVLVTVIGVGAFRPRSRRFHRIAPTVALLLVYLGVGSVALAAQFFVRYHAVAAHDTETQIFSAGTHVVLAAAGAFVLRAHLRGRTRTEWLAANTVTIAYWATYVKLVTPEWFTFQGQAENLTMATLLLLAVLAAVNAVLCARAAQPRVERRLVTTTA